LRYCVEKEELYSSQFVGILAYKGLKLLSQRH
jgi:hypothetical protein